MTYSNINPFLKIVVLVSIFIAAAGMIADWRYTQQYGGVDLRNRVVGSRVAYELRQDPYYFKWSEGQSDRYLDPSDNIAIPVTRLTITPAALGIYSVFTSLTHTQIRYIWFFVQWACLLGSIFILINLAGGSKNPTASANILILGLIGISGSTFWRLHMERGQMYIIYVFLFCLSFFLYKKYEDSNSSKLFPGALIGSGLVLGFLISLRPPYVFALIPILIYKKYKLVSLAVAGMLVGVFLSSLLSPLPLWKNYYQAIKLQGEMRLNENINFRPYKQDNAEGVNLKKFLAVPGEDSSLQTIFRSIFGRWFTSGTLFVLLVVFTGSVSAWLLKFKIPGITVLELFYMGISLSLFSEFFIAASRWPYANVIWLIPLSIILIEYKKITQHFAFYTAYALISLGLMTSVGFNLIPRFTFAGDAGIPVAILIFLLAMVAQKSKNREIKL